MKEQATASTWTTSSSSTTGRSSAQCSLTSPLICPPFFPEIVVEDLRQLSGLAVGSRFAIVDENRVVSCKSERTSSQSRRCPRSRRLRPPTASQRAAIVRALPFGQDELVRTVASANKKTIVAPSPLAATSSSTKWIDSVPALYRSLVWRSGRWNCIGRCALRRRHTHPGTFPSHVRTQG